MWMFRTLVVAATLAASLTPSLANCFSEALQLGNKLDAVETQMEDKVKRPGGVGAACRIARAAIRDMNRAEMLLRTCPALGFVRDVKLVEINTARAKYKTQCL